MSAITIKEIASLAGVSISTVSRVINNMPDVNRLTKQKVRRVIEEHGYVPNINAKTLKQSTTNIICIVVKGIRNPFFAPIVEEIQRVIDSHNYIPLVHYIDESAEEVRCASLLIAEKKALGVIFLGGNPASKIREIAKLKIPCVLATMSAKELELINTSSVCVDDFESARKAISYLIVRGHRTIAILGGRRLDRDLVWNRYAGAKQSFQDHGLIFNEKLYIESMFSLEDAYEMTVHAISEMKLNFTALFSMSDIMAIGAVKAIFDCGLQVPGDISVIGYDGISFANFYNPTLTTVRQPYAEIARRSAELIVQNVQGENIGQNIVLDTEILAGASVKNVLTQETA
jgi:LacI family transcriptional regulator